MNLIPGHHVFWTAPKHGRPHLHDFEIVTAIASALYYRAHSGPMTLWTDEPGRQYFAKLGLLSMYDTVENLVVPRHVDPKIFWAAGKLQVYRSVQAPCTFIDLDAVLYYRIRHVYGPSHPVDVVALHDEPRDWPAYQRDWQEFPAGKWSEGRPWPDQTIKPINVGILQFLNDDLRKCYVDAAFDFIQSFVDSGLPPKFVTIGRQKSVCVDEMVFAEQFLLPVIIRRHGWSVGYLGKFDRNLDHLTPNTVCSHLWNSKQRYLDWPDVRQKYVDAMMARLINQFGSAVKPFLFSSGLSTGSVRDPNSGALRFFKSALQEKLLPGESIDMFGP